MSKQLKEEIERRILSALLHNTKLIDNVGLNSSWFSDKRIANVVEVLSKLDSSDRDLLNVYNELENFEGQFSYLDLSRIQSEFITEATLVGDIKALHKLSAQEQLDSSIELYKLDPKKQTIEEIATAIDEYTKMDEEDDNGFLDSAIDDLNWRMSNDMPSGIKSFTTLDKMLGGGLYGSALITIGARPSVGKTAYSINLAYQIIDKDPEVQVDYFTLEMNKREILNRFISRYTHIPGNSLKQPFKALDMQQKMSVKLAIDWIKSKNLRVYDKVTTLAGISSVIRNNAGKAKPNKYVAIIDYVGLVKVNSRQDRWVQVGMITRELKILANEFDVPIVALAQLNRGVENRQDKVPQLSDLRESGSIEQDSNVVAFLYRPNDEKREAVDLVIQKNREGQLGKISYYFDGKAMNFNEGLGE